MFTRQLDTVILHIRQIKYLEHSVYISHSQI